MGRLNLHEHWGRGYASPLLIYSFYTDEFIDIIDGRTTLSLSKITRSFGAIHALKEVSFGVMPGGYGFGWRNGAGKSSLVKIIGGFDLGTLVS